MTERENNEASECMGARSKQKVWLHSSSLEERSVRGVRGGKQDERLAGTCILGALALRAIQLNAAGSLGASCSRATSSSSSSAASGTLLLLNLVDWNLLGWLAWKRRVSQNAPGSA